jgi:hypothetical protein
MEWKAATSTELMECVSIGPTSAMIDPHVEPTEFSISPEGEVVIEVHQVVRDLNGNLLTDKMVGHMFRIENG